MSDNVTENLGEESDNETRPSEEGTVFLNVVTILGILLCMAMVIFGGVFFHDCPTQPMLAIMLIAQGILSLSLPFLFVLKTIRDLPRTKTTFYTVFITILILSFCCLVAVTSWLAEANCPGTNLFKASTGLITILWVFLCGCVIISFVILCRHRHRRPPRDYY